MSNNHDDDCLSLDSILVDILRREIWIDGPIDGHIARDLVRGCRALLQLNRDVPISLWVNSEGGSVTDGLAIADYIQLVSRQGTPVATYVFGSAYSAAALIAAAGTKGLRYTLPSSRYLIHQLSASNIEGKMEQLESDVKHLNALNSSVANMLANITSQPLARGVADLKKETFLSAEEARRYGLVDQILGPEERRRVR